MSPYLGPNQKVSAEVASNEIADLIERYVGPYHMTRAGVARALTVMFTERWDDLRRAAHQLHDALAIRKSLNMTDPSRNTNPAPPGPAEVNDPEYLPPLRNAADPSEPYTLAGAIERIKAVEARLDAFFPKPTRLLPLHGPPQHHHLIATTTKGERQ